MKFLGGEEGKKEIDEVMDLANKIIEKHNGTPWEVLVRRGAVCIYAPSGD
jgi:hypothetical protein